MTSADIAESYGHTEYAKEIRKFEKQVGHFIFVILSNFKCNELSE